MLKKLYKKYVTTPHNIKTTKSLFSEIEKGNVTEIKHSMSDDQSIDNLTASAMAAGLNRDDKIALQRALRSKGKKKFKTKSLLRKTKTRKGETNAFR